MKLIDVIALAAKMIKEGKTDAEIKKALFDTKGVKVSQIEKVMNLIA